MVSLRPLLRRWLSPRYVEFRRLASASAPSRAAAQFEQAAPSSIPVNRRVNRRRLGWATLAMVLGLISGSLVSHTVAPPPPPKPGSREDALLTRDLEKRIDEEFKVKTLRGKCKAVTRQLKGEEGGWVELQTGPRGRLVEEGMQGARGLSVERLFWNRESKQLVAVTWFGSALSGWPGVVHGGTIATMFCEKLARTALLSRGLEVPELPVERPEDIAEPEQLSLSYVKPTHADQFYVFRCAPAVPLDVDPEHMVLAEPRSGYDMEATLESLDGSTLVKAKARFASVVTPASSGAVVKTDKRQGSSKGFREWMWPSRSSS